MIEKKTDLRIKRTQKAIIDAFYELLDERSFDNITVIDICERALVNRGTFYTHFQDKYQLLEKCIYDIMISFDDEVDNVHGDSDLAIYYNDVIAIGMDFVQMHRKRIRTIISKADPSLIFDKVHEIIVQNIVGKVGTLPPKDGDVLPIEIVAEFYAGGVIQLIKWWIMQDEYSVEETKQQLAKLAVRTINNLYGSSLKNSLR